MFARLRSTAVGRITRRLAVVFLAVPVLWSLFGAGAGLATRGVDGVPPKLLPTTMEAWAQPMPGSTAELGTPAECPETLWAALDAHRFGETERSLELWREVTLPAETAVWKHAALAAISLEANDLAAAARELGIASELEPDHAIVHFLTGLLRLEQAARANDWLDAIELNDVRRADYVPETIFPNNKSTYQLHALIELEKAIETAEYVRPNQLLLADPTSPRVADLLEVMGIANLEGTSHNLAGQLCLERGLLGRAEEHWDAAETQGIHVVLGYRDLAAEYARLDRHADAARANAKDLRRGHDVAVPAKKLLENLGKAFLEDGR